MTNPRLFMALQSASIFLAEYAIWPVLSCPLILALVGKKSQALYAASAGIVTWALGWLIKGFFFMPRPFIREAISPLVTFILDGSFPSSHTAVSFAISFAIYRSSRRLGIFLLLTSGLVGVGRVLVRVHYPIDVLGGMLMGLLVAQILSQIPFRD